MHHRPLRDGPRNPPGHGKVSCSTAVIPAPAAATTSCSAAPRRPTAPFCGGRTCCAASSPSGTTTRRSRFFFPAFSSAPPASSRASTRPATTVSTNWRSPLPSWSGKPLKTGPASRGWWIGCFATCWWTSAEIPTGPNFVSTSSIRRTAPPAGWGCWSFAPLRCRPTPA